MGVTLENGWKLALITDLRRVVAAQPTVFVDEIHGYDAGVAPGDLAAVACLTLPLAPPPARLPAHFDEDNQTWNISSRNPNLRITGTFAGEVKPDVVGFGFLLEILTSFVSVAEFRGRYVLRDGYHRAYRLLAAGVVRVPVFVRRCGEEDSLFRSGMLPEAIYVASARRPWPTTTTTPSRATCPTRRARPGCRFRQRRPVWRSGGSYSGLADGSTSSAK